MFTFYNSPCAISIVSIPVAAIAFIRGLELESRARVQKDGKTRLIGHMGDGGGAGVMVYLIHSFLVL